MSEGTSVRLEEIKARVAEVYLFDATGDVVGLVRQDIPWLIEQLESQDEKLSMVFATLSWLEGWTIDESGEGDEPSPREQAARSIREVINRLNERLIEHERSNLAAWLGDES